MPIVAVRIPQLGEGLQEALLVEFLKKPGDSIKRDEPLYVIETDKATTDVESPFAGTLVAWTVQPGSVLAIGSEIGRMEVADGVTEMPSGHHNILATSLPDTSSEPSRPTVSPGDVIIPPRTRKYLKDVGLLEHIEKIPVRGSKMMPEDVDAYLASIGSPGLGSEQLSQLDGGFAGRKLSEEPHEIVALPKSQVTLNYRMSRGSGLCIPVTVVTDIDWTAMEAIRGKVTGQVLQEGAIGGNIAAGAGEEQALGQSTPTGFAVACWAVVQAMRNHQKFRSVLISDGTALKVFSHVNLGIAVALPGDEMLTAVIRRADQMSPDEFYRAYTIQVEAARNGHDQADETTTVTVSNIGKAGMRIGIPAIVAPAVATLALGEVFQWPIPNGSSFRFRPTVTATLSFDHRIVNGVGAANFLNEVRMKIETARNRWLTCELQ